MKRYNDMAREVSHAARTGIPLGVLLIDPHPGGLCAAPNCPLAGTLWHSTRGSRTGYCRHHFNQSAWRWDEISDDLVARKVAGEDLQAPLVMSAFVRRAREHNAALRRQRETQPA